MNEQQKKEDAVQELIDTLWNVNILHQKGRCDRVYELIDTLWNVNNKQLAEIVTEYRINRYIMECK